MGKLGFPVLLKHTPKPRTRAINLTPLIDVVFILLLFFMLSSSFNRWFALDITMPQKAKNELAENTRIRILNNDGLIGFESEVYMRGDAKLIHLLRQEQSAVILLDAENKVSAQTIVSLIDYLTAQGLENISLGSTFEQQSSRL